MSQAGVYCRWISISFSDLCRRLKCNPSWLSAFMCSFSRNLDSLHNIFSSGDYSLMVDAVYRPNSENVEDKDGGLLILWCLFPSRWLDIDRVGI